MTEAPPFHMKSLRDKVPGLSRAFSYGALRGLTMQEFCQALTVGGWQAVGVGGWVGGIRRWGR